MLFTKKGRVYYYEESGKFMTLKTLEIQNYPNKLNKYE